MNDTWVVDQIQAALETLQAGVEATDVEDTQTMMTHATVFVATVAAAVQQRDRDD